MFNEKKGYVTSMLSKYTDTSFENNWTIHTCAFELHVHINGNNLFSLLTL